MQLLLKSICSWIALMLLSTLPLHAAFGQNSSDHGFRRLLDVFGQSETDTEPSESLITPTHSNEKSSPAHKPFLSRFSVPWSSQPTTEKSTSPDPFTEYGIQRNLATHLTPQNPNRFPDAPNTDQSTIPTNSLSIGSPYPWPVPIDATDNFGGGQRIESVMESVTSPPNRGMEQSPGFVSGASDEPDKANDTNPIAVYPTQVTAVPTQKNPQEVQNGKPISAQAEDVEFGKLDEHARLLALVGDQSILAGDLYSQLEPMMARFRGKMPEDELQAQREQAVKQMLPSLIENKLIFLDFLRTIPRDRLPEIERRVYDEFVKSELPKNMKQMQVNSPTELDAKLRKMGSSLDKQRRLFMEQELARMMVSQNVKQDREITHQQLLDYYYDNIRQYEFQARARWELLSVKQRNYPTRKDAYRTIAEMGNEVLGGAPFSAVAKRSSNGARANSGGLHDWTTQGSLMSEKIDEAIFTIPIGKMSRIIEDNSGFHIVRVIERHNSGRIPFTEAQQGIAANIRKTWLQTDIKKYVDRLRAGSYIWTVFDEQRPIRPHVASPPVHSIYGQG